MSKAATPVRIASISVRYSRSEVGTLAARNSRKNEVNMRTALASETAARLPLACRSPAFAPVEKRQALEQMHILLVFEERAVQRRDQLFRVAGAQQFRADILDQEQ